MGASMWAEWYGNGITVLGLGGGMRAAYTGRGGMKLCLYTRGLRELLDLSERLQPPGGARSTVRLYIRMFIYIIYI